MQQLVIAVWCFTFLSTNLSFQPLNPLLNTEGDVSFFELSGRAKRQKKTSKQSPSSSSSSSSSPKSKSNKSKAGSTKLPRLVIFDLDGCLWKPELFELVTSADGPPFVHNPKDTVPGTTLLSQKGQRLELLGSTRQILHELYSQEKWYPARIGISSRTDPPEWAYNLMEEFAIFYDSNNNINRMTKTPNLLPQVTCQMKNVFDPTLCILDKTMDKATQFERLLERANQLSGDNNKSKKGRLQFKDMVFFDNEAGNCKQVAKLGVTSVYTPKGVTYEAWQNAIQNFPSNRVLGPKMPY